MATAQDILAALTSQQQFIAQQTELLTVMMKAFQKQELPGGSDVSRMERTMETLAKGMLEFHYDPENDGIFKTWYERYTDLFDVDGAHLDDAAKARLLVRKLDTNAHTRFANYILPKRTAELSFDDTKKTLTKIFDRQVTLFNLRYNCLKLTKKESDDYIEYAGIVNRQCEEFKLTELNADQFKCLMFVVGMSAHTDADIRTKLLSLLDSDKTVTLDKLSTEAIRLTSLKHDTKLVENSSSSVQQVKHSGNPTFSKSKPGKTPPKTPCWYCGGLHYARDCQYKSHECTKCKVVGHKEGYCSSKAKFVPATASSKSHSKRHHRKSPKTNSISLVSNIYTSQRKYINVLINNVPVTLQVDTASDISIISADTWKHIGRPDVITTTHSARNASGEVLQLTSEFKCQITWNQQQISNICYVTDVKDLNLMGINWIEAFGLWDVPINTICNQISTATTSDQFVQELQKDFSDVFSDSLGLCTKSEAILYLKPGTRAVFRPKRPVPYAAIPAVERELARLEEMGVISPVNYSPWAAPIVATKKPNGEVRICGDFSTGLNSALESHQYPLPLPEDIFATLAGGKFFSNLDLADAYLQIMVNESSKPLLTINTHRGLFQYNRLCFGVKAAPGIFQQTIDTMLAGLRGVVSYLDDIVIVGKTEAEHRENVVNVLRRIQKWGFHLKPQKCKFMLPSIKYLGIIIDSEGRRPDPEKIKAIVSLSPPSDISTLRSFIGMVSYYGKFIKEMRELRTPFDKLLVKDVPWQWSDECQKSFQKVKQVLQSDLLLTHFDPRFEIKVAADASSYGLGAVILHKFPDKTEKAIAHAARALSPAEQNYSQIEKEALALIFAVTKFHRMLHGRKFTLETDHKPLLTIFGSKKGIPVHTANRLQRWALTLLSYEFDIEHVGTNHFGHADALSRLMKRPSNNETTVIASISSFEAGIHRILNEAVRALPITSTMIQEATATDNVLQKVSLYLRTTWPTNITDKELHTFYNRREAISELNGCLLMSERVIIPVKFQKSILKQLHVGHPGIVRMKALARSYVYWPFIDSQIEELVRRCDRCASVAKAPTKTTLASWPIATKPWSRVHIDYAGPFEGLQFLVVVDSFSKWPEIFIQSTITAAATISRLREIFSRFGLPEILVSDNGTQFTSHAFQQFCAINGIEHLKSPPYHPQSNGQAERFVDTFKRALLKAKGEALTAENLQTFLRCYRTTPNSSVPDNQSPAEIMLNRKVRTTFDLLRPSASSSSAPTRNIKMEKDFNARHGAINRTYKAGDLVYAMQYSSNKRSWIPATVVERLGNVLYNIRIGHRIDRRHANQIRARDAEESKEMSSSLPFDMLIDTFEMDLSLPPVEPNTSAPSAVETEGEVDGREFGFNYPPRPRVAPKRLQMTMSGQSHHST